MFVSDTCVSLIQLAEAADGDEDKLLLQIKVITLFAISTLIGDPGFCALCSAILNLRQPSSCTKDEVCAAMALVESASADSRSASAFFSFKDGEALLKKAKDILGSAEVDESCKNQLTDVALAAKAQLALWDTEPVPFLLKDFEEQCAFIMDVAQKVEKVMHDTSAGSRSTLRDAATEVFWAIHGNALKIVPQAEKNVVPTLAELRAESSKSCRHAIEKELVAQIAHGKLWSPTWCKVCDALGNFVSEMSRGNDGESFRESAESLRAFGELQALQGKGPIWNRG